MNKRLTKLSKYLTYILRHEPESIGLQLDAEGYLNMEELVSAAKANGKTITIEQLRDVARLDENQWFQMSEDGARIRIQAQ